MKHLKEKEEFKFDRPTADILDTFKNPGVDEVVLQSDEVTSLCPVTGQPDFATVAITYRPENLCLESKSLKLYLGSYRGYKNFAEHMAHKIYEDIIIAASPSSLYVVVTFKSRGGVIIQAKKGDWV